MITDEQMRERLKAAKPYTLMILHKTAKNRDPGRDKIVWEHGRRNFALRDQGLLPIVCPVGDESGVAGIGIFTTNAEETRKIVDGDPGVRAGIFTYELHPIRGFPGSALP
ncbi:MAG TPA: hypothetical protein VFL28_04030 [bacterium]|nr:hypothetical protein [bacterium]